MGCGGSVVDNHFLTGSLFILVGPSGVGKNMIMKGVQSRLPVLRQMPTATTRAIREGEQEGREHFFVTLERFSQMIAEQALIEHQEVYPGTYYGTPRPGLQKALELDEKLIADIDVLGAMAIKDAFPENVILIFVAPPSLADLEKRLRTRGNMPETEIAERLKRATFEMSFAPRCNYQIVNDTLEQSVDEVVGLINSELVRAESLKRERA
jgi:guanylate kinase